MKMISLNYSSSNLACEVKDSQPAIVKLKTLNLLLLNVTFMQKQNSTDLQVDDGPKLAEMLVEFADVVEL